jgi:hypothetical protein
MPGAGSVIFAQANIYTVRNPSKNFISLVSGGFALTHGENFAPFLDLYSVGYICLLLQRSLVCG